MSLAHSFHGAKSRPNKSSSSTRFGSDAAALAVAKISRTPLNTIPRQGVILIHQPMLEGIMSLTVVHDKDKGVRRQADISFVCEDSSAHKLTK